MTNENPSEETAEFGITAADSERIAEYLEKPPHRRNLDDLRPDESESGN